MDIPYSREDRALAIKKPLMGGTKNSAKAAWFE